MFKLLLSLVRCSAPGAPEVLCMWSALVIVIVASPRPAQAGQYSLDVGTGFSIFRKDESLRPLLHPSPGVLLEASYIDESLPALRFAGGYRAYISHAESVESGSNVVRLGFLSASCQYIWPLGEQFSLLTGSGLLVPLSTTTPEQLDKETKDKLHDRTTTINLALSPSYAFTAWERAAAIGGSIEFTPLPIVRSSNAKLETYWLKASIGI